MANHSSIPAWEITWTEKTAGLHLWGCKRVGQDLVAQQQQQCIIVEHITRQKQISMHTHCSVSPQTKHTEIIIVSYSHILLNETCLNSLHLKLFKSI